MSNPNDLTSVIGAVAWMLSPIQERRLFAAMAMQGLCANEHLTKNPPIEIPHYRECIASLAAAMADALIAELAKPKETPFDERGFPVTP